MSELKVNEHRSELSVENNHNSADQQQFTIDLQKYYSGHKENSKKCEWTNEKIQSVIKLIDEYNLAKGQGKRPSDKQYHHAKKYDIMTVGTEKVLIMKRKSHSDSVVQVIPSSEYFQRILDAHIATGHGQRDKIVHALRNKYVIPIFAITIFLQLCAHSCPSKKSVSSKKSLPKSGIVVKPLISEDFHRRGQVDLMDFQSSPDGEYKWLLQYQDHLTKFCFLRPLKSKGAKEVAIEILKIFLEVGCPSILQSDNGREFTTSVLKEIRTLWPTCKIVNGRPRHPQSQGSIERSNQDVKNMIRAWMVDNNSTNWSIGCYFAQFHKNSSYHSKIARTPFKALFGDEPRCGLSSYLSKNIISKLDTEEDIEKFLGEMKKNASAPLISTDNISLDQVIISNESDKKPVIIEELLVNKHSDKDMTQTNEQEKKIIICNKINILEQALPLKDSNILPDMTHNAVVVSEIVNINKSDIIAIKNEENVPEVSTEIITMGIQICNDSHMLLNTKDNPVINEKLNVLNNESFSAHTCLKCKNVTNLLCDSTNEDASHGSQLMCNLCVSEANILQERRELHIHLKRAAEKITVISSKKFKDIDIATTVLIEVPKVDRRPLDRKNVIGKVMEKKQARR